MDNRITVELEKEICTLLLEISRYIQENNDNNSNSYGFNNKIHNARKTLGELKELYWKMENASLSSLCHQSDVPMAFRCPISGEIMNDPVLLKLGKINDRQIIKKWLVDILVQTYDRPFIEKLLQHILFQTCDRPSVEKWLQYILQTHPETRQVLSHAVIASNQQVRELIHRWCKVHVIKLSPPVNAALPYEAVLPTSDRGRLVQLLNKLYSSSLSEKKRAVNSIRLLTTTKPSVCSYFGETPDRILQLLDPFLLPVNFHNNPDLHSDLVAVIFNISIDKNNKQILGEYPPMIPLLIYSLVNGSIDTRSNAAATLFSLSSLDSNKILIGKSVALEPLVNLLAEGRENSEAMKHAAKAIYSICLAAENRIAVGWAVRVILGKIKDGVINEGLLILMALLATHQSGVEALEELGGVKCLLAVIRDGKTTVLNMEYCISILCSICRKNRAVPWEIRDEENANRTISVVAEQGTCRAKEEANDILDWLQKNTKTNLATTS